MTGREFIEFYSQVTHEGGCLIWTGRVGQNGYGYFQHRGQTRLAHRVAMEIATPGGIPPGKWVLHRETCDKRCVDHHHLSIGTPSENAVSAWLAGKMNQPRLSSEERQGLEYLVSSGVPTRLATRAYGVHRNYLSDRKWKETRRTA